MPVDETFGGRVGAELRRIRRGNRRGAPARVKAGALWLDVHSVGWWRKIKPALVDVRKDRHHPVQAACGSWADVWLAECWGATDVPAALGFLAYLDPNTPHGLVEAEALNDAWGRIAITRTWEARQWVREQGRGGCPDDAK